jgi:hypothetical protein
MGHSDYVTTDHKATFRQAVSIGMEDGVTKIPLNM